MYVTTPFGATTTPRPPIIQIMNQLGLSLGESMKTCNQKPRGVALISAYESMDKMGYPGWKFAYYAEPEGVTYSHIKAADSSDSFWLYPHGLIPCAGNSSDVGEVFGSVKSGRPAMVKELQNALNAYYLAGNAEPMLSVDGIAGPATCKAAYQAQWDWLQDDSWVLSPDFFAMLNLPDGYHMHLKHICVGEYEGHTSEMPTNGAGPSTKKTTTTPAPSQEEIAMPNGDQLVKDLADYYEEHPQAPSAVAEQVMEQQKSRGVAALLVIGGLVAGALIWAGVSKPKKRRKKARRGKKRR